VALVVEVRITEMVQLEQQIKVLVVETETLTDRHIQQAAVVVLDKLG
jgi:hypothetical protein